MSLMDEAVIARGRQPLQFNLRTLLLATLIIAASLAALRQSGWPAATLALALFALLAIPTGRLLWDACLGAQALSVLLGWCALADRDVFRYVFAANLAAAALFGLMLAAWAAAQSPRRWRLLIGAVGINAAELAWIVWVLAERLPFASQS